MIQDIQCDTKLPRNLFDEDFGPDSVQLPPSRPEMDVTPMLYTICKARLCLVFRDVYTRVSLGRTEAYSEIMLLHQRLQVAKESISPRLQVMSLQQSVTGTPYLLSRGYGLELLYQKTMCMLHRHHMTESYRNPKYNFSRSCCLEAAMTTLHHQQNIHVESKPGGLLHQGRWPVSSFEQSDFVLASTIVLMELTSRSRNPQARQKGNDNETFWKYSDHDMLKALQHSHVILGELKETSSECQKAFKVLSGMLRRFGYHDMQQTGNDKPTMVETAPAYNILASNGNAARALSCYIAYALWNPQANLEPF